MKNKKLSENELIIAFLMAVGVCVIWSLSWYFIDKYISGSTNRGTFGDKFGAVNALFSGLAFAGIIFTILLQRKELQLQRDELEQTRDVFKEQNEMISQQKFENTFFQMLNLFHSIVENIEVDGKGKDVYNGQFYTREYEKLKGRECFKLFHLTMKEHLEYILSNSPNYVQETKLLNLIEVMNEEDNLVAYSIVYENFKSDLSHYFRTLYHIVKLVHETRIEDKKRYMSIIRSQLSSYEQAILFYNCLFDYGKEKFFPLIEEYNLMKNLDRTLVFNPVHLKLYKSIEN